MARAASHSVAPVETPRPGFAALLKPAAMLFGLLALGLAARALLLRHGGAAGLAHAHLSWWGFLALGTAICAVGLPRQAVCFAAGFAYGSAAGLGLAFAANLLACIAGFGFAAVIARAWLQRRLSDRWARRIAFLCANPFAAVLTLRLLPVGSSLLINLLAGAAGLRLLPFAAATALGSLPQTVIFTLLGGGTRIGHAGQIAAAVALFGLSGACGIWLLGRGGREETAA